MPWGVPVVVCGVGGIPDLVVDSEPGSSSRPATWLRSQCVEALVEDPERRRRMGAAARSSIERDFDAAVNVPRILAAMKQAVDSDSGFRSWRRRGSMPP